MRIFPALVLGFFIQAYMFSLPVGAAAQGLPEGFSQGGLSREDIPKEPGWKAPAYRGWEVMSIPGLISTYYDLDLDGTLDYMVIRKILRKASAEETDMAQAIDIARYDSLAVYFSHPLIYFASRYPLFYCLGLDYRKNCRNIWVDIAEDGLNGNEDAYTLSTPSPNVR
ncbi:hypothetical protein UR09_06500 [Candidatus Nitromaritima sp. SCGC AAA799-A02]|nr:hypothetical protein UR09_06500 [Candidatus Nitromaritima sp. SCGC AAA799-A02]KMP10385.1 hypothetical protein UZ36_07825 [Candidatus Nitromaritima sp. SCGC AAA799-C22]